MLKNIATCEKQVISTVEQTLQLAREMKATAFAQRLEENLSALRSIHYNIAIVGGIKRGKSTLINTLLGCDSDDLSPIDYKTCTSAIVHYMDLSCLPEVEEPHAKLYFKGQSEPVRESIHALRDYICEENNPDNNKGVVRVEVYGDFPLLGKCCLVDTPGADAIIERHGELVFNYLSNADAIIMTTMSTQAMTYHDARMLKEIGENSPERIFYVLTRVDKLRPTARPVVENHVKEEIERYGFTKPDRIYPIAAKKVHDAMINHEDEATINELRRSWGIQTLEDELGRFLDTRSNTTKAIQNRMRVALEAVQEFLTKKVKENNELLNNHDINVEDIENKRKEVLRKYQESKAAMSRSLEKFKSKWNRETQQMTNRMQTILSPKLQNAISLALETPGIMNALGNAFGLGKLVDKHLSPILNEFAAQSHERFNKLVTDLDEELGDSEAVDFFISKNAEGSLLSAVSSVGVLAIYGTAISGGVSAASGVLTALGSYGAASAAKGGVIAAVKAFFVGNAAANTASSALATSISGAVVPILVAFIAIKCAAPVINWITRLVAPGKVDAAVKKAVQSMTAQAEAMRDMVVQAFESTLENAREEKEQELVDLEDKLRDWSPEKREQISRQNEEINAVLEQVNSAARAALKI